MKAVYAKTCTRCKKKKPLRFFGPDRRNIDGHRSRCRSCENDVRRRIKKHFIRTWEIDPVVERYLYRFARKTSGRFFEDLVAAAQDRIFEEGPQTIEAGKLAARRAIWACYQRIRRSMDPLDYALEYSDKILYGNRTGSSIYTARLSDDLKPKPSKIKIPNEKTIIKLLARSTSDADFQRYEKAQEERTYARLKREMLI